MKKRYFFILAIIIVCSLLTYKHISDSKAKAKASSEAMQYLIDLWTEKNQISIDSYICTPKSSVEYNTITVYWDGFEQLSKDQMKSVVKSWYGYTSIDNDGYNGSLDYIVSNGKQYEIDTGTGSVKLNGERIVEPTYRYSSHSSTSSSSQKTAKCNYCSGTGKVNGSTCPWCNGSGKTYNNMFNDLLG